MSNSTSRHERNLKNQQNTHTRTMSSSLRTDSLQTIKLEEDKSGSMKICEEREIARIERELQNGLGKEMNKNKKVETSSVSGYSDSNRNPSRDAVRYCKANEYGLQVDKLLKNAKFDSKAKDNCKSEKQMKTGEKHKGMTCWDNEMNNKEMKRKDEKTNVKKPKTIAEELFSISLADGTSYDKSCSTSNFTTTSSSGESRMSSGDIPLSKRRSGWQGDMKSNMRNNEKVSIENKKDMIQKIEDNGRLFARRLGMDMSGTTGMITRGKGLKNENKCGRNLLNLSLRRKLESWGPGLTPQVIYAWDGIGRNNDGLTETLLPRLSMNERSWDIVRHGEEFGIHLVGWYIGKKDKKNGKGIVHSSVLINGIERICVHSRHENAEGYYSVGSRDNNIVKSNEIGDEISIYVSISREEGEEIVSSDLRWRLSEKRQDKKYEMSASMVLRYGYYFCLGNGCNERLYASTETPEIVQLVGRRVTDGSIERSICNQLSYIVIRVATD